LAEGLLRDEFQSGDRILVDAGAGDTLQFHVMALVSGDGS